MRAGRRRGRAAANKTVPVDRPRDHRANVASDLSGETP
jgi:hypothetical protein